MRERGLENISAKKLGSDEYLQDLKKDDLVALVQLWKSRVGRGRHPADRCNERFWKSVFYNMKKQRDELLVRYHALEMDYLVIAEQLESEHMAQPAERGN